MKKILSTILLVIVLLFLTTLSIKGDFKNSLEYQKGYDTKLGSPFESSGSNSRYALTKSIAENNSFYFDEVLAKFASPDITEYQGRYTSLFTPGVSFVTLPFYYLGKLIGAPQLFAFASTGIFAILNVVLIYMISRKFNVSKIFSWIGGLIYLFATPALAYSNSLTQHHLSSFLILLGILVAAGKRNFLTNILLGLLIGAGALVDIPNLFMMAPIGLYVFFKHFSLVTVGHQIKLKINPLFVAIVIGLIPMFVFFGWYNYQTVGSYTKLAQSVGRSDFFATEDIKKINNQERIKSKGEAARLLPFDTRFQLNGFYILTISNERGIFYYSPILTFGVIGLIIAFRKNNDLAALITSVALVNIVLYSMFGDPWGGWSFGARYMIPSMAMLSVGIGAALSKFSRNPFFVAIFIIFLIYSVGVNVLGAVTTSLVPPKVEALNLVTSTPYTYEYNFKLAQEGKAGSLVYNLYFRNLINVDAYIYFYASIILILIISLLTAGIIFRKDQLKWAV